VLSHFLQVLQVLALTFHYSGHPGETHECHKNGISANTKQKKEVQVPVLKVTSKKNMVQNVLCHEYVSNRITSTLMFQFFWVIGS